MVEVNFAEAGYDNEKTPATRVNYWSTKSEWQAVF